MLVGDLNVFYPEEAIHAMLAAAGFRSAYAAVHGADCRTCPTPLKAPTIDPAATVDQICDFVLVRQLQLQSGAQGGVGVTVSRLVPTAAAIAADRPAPGDPTLYPSDHYAVTATLAFEGLVAV